MELKPWSILASNLQFPPLIVPYGIETAKLTVPLDIARTFNCTLWN